MNSVPDAPAAHAAQPGRVAGVFVARRLSRQRFLTNTTQLYNHE